MTKLAPLYSNTIWFCTVCIKSKEINNRCGRITIRNQLEMYFDSFLQILHISFPLFLYISFDFILSVSNLKKYTTAVGGEQWGTGLECILLLSVSLWGDRQLSNWQNFGSKLLLKNPISLDQVNFVGVQLVFRSIWKLYYKQELKLFIRSGAWLKENQGRNH